jgi:hypothetical protein
MYSCMIVQYILFYDSTTVLQPKYGNLQYDFRHEKGMFHESM